MPTLTPQFVHDLETGMQVVQLQEYQRLAPQAIRDVQGLFKDMPAGQHARERLFWMWDTAGIQQSNKFADEIEYSDLMMSTQLFEHDAMTAGLKLQRFQLEDLDGGGVNAATEWTRQITAQAAYWKPEQIFKAINAGAAATSLTYDGLPFFTATTGHPFNPKNVVAGRFDNVFTGSAETSAAAGLNPGACPVAGVSVATDQANIMKAIIFIEGSLKMPNGTQPRRLRVTKIVYPTAMRTAMLNALNAEFIAGTLASSSGTSGSQDVRAIKTALGRLTPVEVPELGAAFGGSDTTYYLCVEAEGTQAAALVYFERESFNINYHTGMTQVELDRANFLEWVGRGRYKVGYAHPFMMFKCPAS